MEISYDLISAIEKTKEDIEMIETYVKEAHFKCPVAESHVKQLLNGV